MAKWTVERRSALHRDGVFIGHLSGLSWGHPVTSEPSIMGLAHRIVALLNAAEPGGAIAAAYKHANAGDNCPATIAALLEPFLATGDRRCKC